MKVSSFSELWFNNGGPANAFPLPISSIDFTARKAGPGNVLTSWLSYIDTQASSYELQRADDGEHFATVATVASVHDNGHSYSYTDVPGAVTAPALYYRLRYKLKDEQVYYSATRQVIWSGKAAAVQLYPNPTPDGAITLDWNTAPGAELEVVVTDVSGRIVLRANDVARDYNTRTPLSIGNAAKGIYFLHATVAGERFDFKIAVQ